MATILKTMEKQYFFLIGQSTILMTMFNDYAKFPECTRWGPQVKSRQVDVEFDNTFVGLPFAFMSMAATYHDCSKLWLCRTLQLRMIWWGKMRQQNWAMKPCLSLKRPSEQVPSWTWSPYQAWELQCRCQHEVPVGQLATQRPQGEPFLPYDYKDQSIARWCPPVMFVGL